LHPVDAIEDILISIGYSNIKPEYAKLACVGAEAKKETFLNTARESCVGLGLQEILTFTLSSREKQETKIGLADSQFAEIANPISNNWSVFRKQLFPETLEFFAKNKNAQYPQRVFEIGKCIELSANAETGVKEPAKLCIAIAGKEATFTLIKSVLDAVCKNIGMDYEITESTNPAFVSGKQGTLNLKGKRGIIGEINQKTLPAFGIEMPVCLLEIEL
jgi:phenylalanyl-tRNA synthetase beta chain